ncbi:hypothetical protein Tco_0133855 [Tanacetum coccineum]
MQFGGPFQGGGYRATTSGYYQRNNANPSYQERRKSMEDTLSKFMSESAKRHEENSNLIKEILASTDVQFEKSWRCFDAQPLRKVRGFILGKEFKTREDELLIGIDDYPSYCDYDKKIHIDCAHSLKFSCMIGFEFTHANVFPLLYVNVMSKKFHNSIMKDKMVYKGNNILGALMNIPIFVGTFSVMMDFVVLEDMNAYRDEGMGDVIFSEPFLREVRIKAKRFEGIITLYNGDDEVTYQMVRSHPRFKRHNNEQCNKIPPLLKVSEKDEKNELSHAYQKLKGFYKGVLNRTRLHSRCKDGRMAHTRAH